MLSAVPSDMKPGMPFIVMRVWFMRENGAILTFGCRTVLAFKPKVDVVVCPMFQKLFYVLYTYMLILSPACLSVTYLNFSSNLQSNHTIMRKRINDTGRRLPASVTQFLIDPLLESQVVNLL